MEMTFKETREQMCDIGKKMWQLGWVAANDGNITVKVAKNRFLATPTGVSKADMTPEMLLVVDSKGVVIEGQEGCKPSSEIKMHLRCYQERDDVKAVLHAHPPVATGYAVAGKHLDCYSMIETVVAIGSVPVTPFATPSTEEVPNTIAPYLAHHDVLLLANHGALTVGDSLKNAYFRMETLELFAKISLNATLLGGAKELPKETIDKLIGLRSFYKVTGKHPGYKKYS